MGYFVFFWSPRTGLLLEYDGAASQVFCLSKFFVKSVDEGEIEAVVGWQALYLLACSTRHHSALFMWSGFIIFVIGTG